MIVGDSITEGSAGDYTWQYRLYEHLRADGISPQMVGPYDSLYNNVTNTEGDQSYADPRFGHANDARWGLTLFREKDAIGNFVATYRPDYLLVLIGLDDISWYGLSQPVMASNLEDFIVAARAARPRIRIVLGLIPPDIHERTNPSLAANIASYNTTIAQTAVRLRRPHRRSPSHVTERSSISPLISGTARIPTRTARSRSRPRSRTFSRAGFTSAPLTRRLSASCPPAR